MSIADGLLLDAREASPALVALAVVLLADALLDGTLLIVVIMIAVAGMFAAFAYRDRSPGGIERARARERFLAQLDGTERTARDAARFLPLVVAIGLELIAGFDTTLFVTASLVGFVVCQALFGLLLYVRRHD